MIIRSSNLIFVHIPKCAGTSVEEGILDFLDLEPSKKMLMGKNMFPWAAPPRLDHLTALEFQRILRKDAMKFCDFNSFSIVRCPWARLVSEYNWRGVSRFFRLSNNKPYWSFREFVLEAFPTKHSDNYLRGYDNYRHVIPQSSFTHDKSNNQMVKDIFTIGEVNTKLVSYLNKIGVDVRGFDKSNHSKFRDPKSGEYVDERLSLRDYYDDETNYFVEKYYKKDIQNFGFDNPLL